MAPDSKKADEQKRVQEWVARSLRDLATSIENQEVVVTKFENEHGARSAGVVDGIVTYLPDGTNKITLITRAVGQGEKVQADIPPTLSDEASALCPACGASDWQAEVIFNGEGEVSVPRCQKCGWPKGAV